MKYGVAIRIYSQGYVEAEASCIAEAVDIASEMALDDRVLFHETEIEEAKIEAVIPDAEGVDIDGETKVQDFVDDS